MDATTAETLMSLGRKGLEAELRDQFSFETGALS
jgi:hypothetical protein